MQRRIVAGLAGVGILLAAGAVAVGVHAGTTSPPARDGAGATARDTIHWSACTSAEVASTSHAVCGTVTVPLDYAAPHGATITLAVSMVRHTSSAAHYQGAIVVNPGGPGEPGLGLSSLGQRVPEGVGGDYDWIGFDPRGTGESRPAVVCEPDYFDGPRPAYTPTSKAVTAQWLQRAAAYSAACAKHSGALLDHMTTADWARDVDSIRQALGQSQISYYGYSGGSYLGEVYGTLFPSRVRRMVLDSNVDPTRSDYRQNLDQDTAFEANMRAWFAWLARGDDVYHLGRSEAAVQRVFYATQAQLQAHPVDQLIGGDAWTDIFLAPGYSQRQWNVYGLVFADWVNGHDQNPLVAAYKYEVGGNDPVYPVYLAVECTDGPWPGVTKTLADNTRLAVSAPYGTWQNAWFNAPCLTWKARAHTPITVDGSHVASTLLIDQTGDAATPYEGSLEVRRLFPHSALLALPGGLSHADSLSGDTCEDDVVAHYLATGALPVRLAGNRADATCRPRPPPSAQAPPAA